MIERSRHISAAPLALGAASMLAVAVVGGAVFDELWLALLPATVLVFLTVGAIQARWDGQDGRLRTIGAALLRVGCIGLLAAAIAGFVVVAVRGVEPTWLSVAAVVSGVTFVIGEVIFGITAAWRRAGPRGAAILFAISVPLGLAIDFLPQLVVPIPLFFAGVGLHIGLGLLALSLARLGWAARRSIEASENHRGSSIAAALAR